MDVGASTLTMQQVQDAANAAAKAAVSPFSDYGSRARTLPVLTPMNASLLTLLSAVVSATNALFAQLSGYAPYEAAGGAAFSLIALQPSPQPTG